MALCREALARSFEPRERQIAELDQAELAGDFQNLDKQTGQRVEMDFAKVADRTEVGSLQQDRKTASGWRLIFRRFVDFGNYRPARVGFRGGALCADCEAA